MRQSSHVVKLIEENKMYTRLIHERIEGIHGKMVVFRAWETKTTGYKIQVKNRVCGQKALEAMRRFRVEVEQMVKK